MMGIRFQNFVLRLAIDVEPVIMGRKSKAKPLEGPVLIAQVALLSLESLGLARGRLIDLIDDVRRAQAMGAACKVFALRPVVAIARTHSKKLHHKVQMALVWTAGVSSPLRDLLATVIGSPVERTSAVARIQIWALPLQNSALLSAAHASEANPASKFFRTRLNRLLMFIILFYIHNIYHTLSDLQFRWFLLIVSLIFYPQSWSLEFGTTSAKLARSNLRELDFSVVQKKCTKLLGT